MTSGVKFSRSDMIRVWRHAKTALSVSAIADVTGMHRETVSAIFRQGCVELLERLEADTRVEQIENFADPH